MQIKFDTSDPAGMVALMDKYGDAKAPFFGENTEGERTAISIFPDRIACEVYQKNGWVMVATFWRDGTTEETYTGRWKTSKED